MRRLVKLGVVKLTPTPDGTGVNLTRQGRVAFSKKARMTSKELGLRLNPAIKRADLRLLQSLAARDCARVRATKIETAADVEQAQRVARAERQATKAKTAADVERARELRDMKRGRARAACDTAREESRRAKGGQPRRTTARELARERVQLRDAEIAAAFGSVPGALELYRKSGGGIKWGGPRGVERFGEYIESERGRGGVLHTAPRGDVSEREARREEARYYLEMARRKGQLDEAAEIEQWLRENPRRRRK